MKTTLIPIKFLICLLVLVMPCLFACKKGSPEPRKYGNTIQGPWRSQKQFGNLLNFGKDGNVIVNVPDKDFILQSYFGKFTANGDSLTVTLTETASKYIDNAYNKTPLAETIRENYRFTVTADSLVLFSTPPDAAEKREVFYRPVEDVIIFD